MIRDIGTELQTYLLSQGCPLAIVYGPEPSAPTTWGRERIVIEQTTTPSKYGPAISQHINPKHRRTRSVNYKITIYAKSGKAGALPFEHNRRGMDLLDLVEVGLDNVAASLLKRVGGWAPTSSALVPPADLAKSEIAGGAVYELLFTFDRPVVVKTFAGAIQPEHTLAAGFIRSRTSVSLTHGSDDDEDELAVETACGA